MDPDIRIYTPFLIVALLAVNAFFVAGEFALIAIRRSRLEQNAREGDRRAARVLPTLNRAEELALAAQIGSSGASLLLGFLVVDLGRSLLERTALADEPAVLAVQGIDAAPWVFIAAALLVATCTHVVLAEQVPKILGIQRAEWIATRITAWPLRVFALLIRPLTWALSGIVNAIARLCGVASAGFHPLVHTPEEIRVIVAQSHEEGVVEEDERQMIHGVFEFSDTVAREVMTPRTDMIAVPATVTLDELIAIVTDEGHSRLPVYDGTLDNIIGVLLAKDLLSVLWTLNGGGPALDVRRIMREPYFVPDTKPVDDILAEFRQQSVHLAIVLDEFGGTHGLLTMEDLLEEIVGDINDEYDIAEPEEFSPTPEGDVLIDGGASISEVNERFELSLPEEDFDTIGGYVFGALGRVPVAGDMVEPEGAEGEARIQVEETEERRVTLVRLTRRSTAAIQLVPEE